MAWPDYSETTYAFLLLRELETKHGGGPLFLNFLTPHQEAQPGGGYDASVDLSGTLHFLQFKRSNVMTYGNAHEFQAGDFTTKPVYRMHLHRKMAYWQHKQLQTLEAAGHSVFYASSGAPSLQGLRLQAQTQSVINNSGFFLPGEILLPDFHDEHHVSFVPSSPYFRVYSQEGERYRRKVPNEETFLTVSRQRRRSSRRNKALLRRFVRGVPVERFSGAPESFLWRAALWAQVRYDLQLILLPD